MLLLSVVGVVKAQTDSSTVLETVEVNAVLEHDYSVGSRVMEVDSAQLARYQSGRLSDLLLKETAVYIKQQGNGMLSTISLRGTGSSHTSVMWNGFQVNYPTLGQADYAVLPTIAADKVALFYGSGATLYGNGAIGGALQLATKPDWTPGTGITLQQDAGSFGYRSTSAKYSLGTGKLSLVSRFYTSSLDNNFTFKNTEKFGVPYEQQQNAALQSGGFVQDIHYKIKRNLIAFGSFWFNQNHKQIQALMTSNNSHDFQWDKSLRSVGGLKYYYKRGYSELKLAHFRDLIRYVDETKSIDSRSVTNHYSVLYNHKYTFNNKLSLKAGGQFSYYTTAVDNYADGQTDKRGSIYLSGYYHPFKKLYLNLNLRQAHFKDVASPFSPSLGLRYNLFTNNHHRIDFKSSVSRNYRAPTLNERYWVPGGNPNILPEDGFSTEGGMSYAFCTKQLTFSTEITAFHLLVNDWIQWLQVDTASFYAPVNINKVKSRGLELNAKVEYQLHNWTFLFRANYAYTRSTNLAKISPTDNGIDKQLIYVPEHSWSGGLDVRFKKYDLSIVTYYTGLRYTTRDNLDFLPGFAATDLSLGKRFDLGNNYSIGGYLRVNNLFDATYQNIAQKAMPGRNYNFSIILTKRK